MHPKKILTFFLDAIGIVLLLGGVGLDLITQPAQYHIGAIQIAISAAGFALTLAATFLLIGESQRAYLLPKLPSAIIFIISLLLLALNITGVIIPLRNPAVYQGMEYGGKERAVQYKAKDTYQQMNRIAAIALNNP